MPYHFLFLLIALLSLSSGNRASSTTSGHGEISTPPPQTSAELGQAVTLVGNTPVAIAGENLTVTFDEVLADGRCPAQILEGSARPVMMQCTASLPVELAISVRRGDTVQHLTFSANTDTAGNVNPDVRNTTPVQQSGAHIIALEQVLPYPMVDTPRADDDYAITLRVTRKIAKGPVTQAPASVPARLGEPVTLGISQIAVVNPGGIKVTVAGVTDHRCPAMAICELPTIVVVDLDVQVDGLTTHKSVGGVTDEAGHVTGPLMETRGIPWAQVGDYTIELTDVTPYPQPVIETDPAAFAITLIVTAVQRQKPTLVAVTPTPPHHPCRPPRAMCPFCPSMQQVFQCSV